VLFVPDEVAETIICSAFGGFIGASNEPLIVTSALGIPLNGKGIFLFTSHILQVLRLLLHILQLYFLEMLNIRFRYYL
jgi:hypothetical protein